MCFFLYIINILYKVIKVEKYITINSNNLLHNYKYFDDKTNKKIIAVIKDNAYGHGYKQVIEVLENVDVTMYAVSNLEEAILASRYTDKDILILDRFTDYSKLTKQLVISIISKEHLLEVIHSNIEARIHLKVNTGMNRKGINAEEFDDCFNLIKKSNSLHLEGIYTHYASNKKSNLEKQFQIFKSVCKKLDRNKYLIHASSSVSSLMFRENLTNSCRIGIGLYGLNHRYPLLKQTKPVLSFYSYVDNCFQIDKNCKVGYDYKFKTPSKGFLLLSPVGYGLGYSIKQKYYAFYKGEYLKQMSRVCMDCCIYFSNKPIQINEEIELFGEHIKIDNIAKINKCSPYEIVTLLDKDIKRIVI